MIKKTRFIINLNSIIAVLLSGLYYILIHVIHLFFSVMCMHGCLVGRNHSQCNSDKINRTRGDKS